MRVLQELIAASWADTEIAKVVRAGIKGWIDLILRLVRKAEQTIGSLGPVSAHEVTALVANAFIARLLLSN